MQELLKDPKIAKKYKKTGKIDLDKEEKILNRKYVDKKELKED